MEQIHETNVAGKVITALIIGLILGFSAGVFWQERRQGPVSFEERRQGSAEERVATGTVSEQGIGTETPFVRGETTFSEFPSVISVSNQKAGGVVMVTSVRTDEAVWVAVREEREGGLGNILGAQKVLPGQSELAVVELLRPTQAGKKYFVTLYRDIGSPAFNYREDVLMPVQASFSAQ